MRYFDVHGFLERATGIEPVSSAWKAEVLPLHNARDLLRRVFQLQFEVKKRKPAPM